LSWNDNVKARWVNDNSKPVYRNNGAAPLRSQEAIYSYYQNKLNNH